MNITDKMVRGSFTKFIRISFINLYINFNILELKKQNWQRLIESNPPNVDVSIPKIDFPER